MIDKRYITFLTVGFPRQEYKFPLNGEKNYSVKRTEDKINKMQKIEFNMLLRNKIYRHEKYISFIRKNIQKIRFLVNLN